MNKNFGKIINLVFKAVALAMAVAVVVMSIIDILGTSQRIMLLGIGLFCLAINAIDKE